MQPSELATLQATPDTPLMTGASGKTSSSVSSADLWSSLAEDRLRQSGALPEEAGPNKVLTYTT